MKPGLPTGFFNFQKNKPTPELSPQIKSTCTDRAGKAALCSVNPIEQTLQIHTIRSEEGKGKE